MLTLYQIDGASVPPVADATLYNFLLANQTGVLMGCEVTSAGGTQLRVASGWLIIKGHLVKVDSETINATPSASGTVKGRLAIKIDVSSRDKPISWTTVAASTLPALTQEDINGSGTVYEMAMAEYTVTATAISALSSVYSTVVLKTENAGAAEKLKTARKIGNASFDGTKDLSLSDIGAATAAQGKKADEAMPKRAFSLSGTTLTITW